MWRSWTTARHGNPENDPRARARPAVDLYASAQIGGPLAHGREPHASPGGATVETTPVVDHPRHQRLALRPQPYLDAARSRVAPGVCQGLLQDSRKLHAQLPCESSREIVLNDQAY